MMNVLVSIIWAFQTVKWKKEFIRFLATLLYQYEQGGISI